MTKKSSWIYGKSPNPTSWHETANILKEINKKPKSKGVSLMSRLDAIEKLLKEK